MNLKFALYNRSRDNKDVAGKEAFSGDAVPFGFCAGEGRLAR